MTIQATKKLQDFLGIKTTELPPNDEGFSSWHGNVFMIGRKKCLLVTHNESLYSIFLYGITKKELPTLAKTLERHLSILMREDGFTLSEIIRMVESCRNISYAKTSDRSVLGNMNDMIHMLKYYNMTEDELSLSARINSTPYARGKFYFPKQILKRLLEEEK